MEESSPDTGLTSVHAFTLPASVKVGENKAGFILS